MINRTEMGSKLKTNLIIFIIVAIAILLCVLLLVFRLSQWMQYTEVDAKIVGIQTENKDHSGQTKTIPSHFVVYEYDYGDNSYKVRQQVFTEFGLNKGELKKIRIDPANPDTAFNSYQTKGIIAVLVFLVLFDGLLLVIMHNTVIKNR